MRVLVTGAQGQLARCLAEAVASVPQFELVFAARPEFDLSQPDQSRQIALAMKPDIIVNAAAYTAVDKAEQEQSLAMAVNRDGAGAMALAAQDLGIPIIHLSTDYVFTGNKSVPYVESDETGPIGVYGKTKLAGELAVAAATPRHIILRTAWVYSAFGANFVKTMLRLGRERPELRVVNDQTGNPTSAHDLADAVLQLCTTIAQGNQARGVFHCAGQGETTWFGFAQHIFKTAERLGAKVPVLSPIGTADYPTPAKRPANSRLDCGKLRSVFGIALPHWQDSTERCVSRLLAEQAGSA